MRNIFIILVFIFINSVSAQVNGGGIWRPLGDVDLLDVIDDADNGDGLNDGAILVDGKSDTEGQGAKFYFRNDTLEDGTAYTGEVMLYNTGSSFCRVKLTLYNLTDNVELASSGEFSVSSGGGPLLYTVSYTGVATDAGDDFELRLIRTDDGSPDRDFKIDFAKLNTTTLFESLITVNGEGFWDKVGTVNYSNVSDDADNGDGLNDGAIYVDGQTGIGDEGLTFKVRNTNFLEEEKYKVTSVVYNTGTSYCRVKIVIYNVSDSTILASSDSTFLAGSGGTETINLVYFAKNSDVGDKLEVRVIRSDDGHTSRNFKVDFIKLNNTTLTETFVPVDLAGCWKEVGDVNLSVVSDDADNGDGLNDGAIYVDGQSWIDGQGIKYVFSERLLGNEKYKGSIIVYNTGASFCSVKLVLYNTTDGIELSSSPPVAISSTDPGAITIDVEHVVTASDVGDNFELRLIRADGGATYRNIKVDYAQLNDVLISDEFLPISNGGISGVGTPSIIYYEDFSYPCNCRFDTQIVTNTGGQSISKLGQRITDIVDIEDSFGLYNDYFENNRNQLLSPQGNPLTHNALSIEATTSSVNYETEVWVVLNTIDMSTANPFVDPGFLEKKVTFWTQSILADGGISNLEVFTTSGYTGDVTTTTWIDQTGNLDQISTSGDINNQTYLKSTLDLTSESSTTFTMAFKFTSSSSAYSATNRNGSWYISDVLFTGDTSTTPVDSYPYSKGALAQDESGDVDSDVAVGVVRISNPSNLDDNEYLIWGGSSASNVFNDIGGNSLSRRNNVTYEVKEVDSLGNAVELGTIDLEIDVASLDFGTYDVSVCSGIQLIIGNETFTIIDHTHLMTYVGPQNKLIVTGIDLDDGDYFTFVYRDKIVLDNTTWHGTASATTPPTTTDDCFKLTVRGNSPGTGDAIIDQAVEVREIEVEDGSKLVISSGNILTVENGINTNTTGEVRALGTAQLLQTHTGTNLNTGTGNYYSEQTVTAPNRFSYNYLSSPVNNSGTYALQDVLKDGTTALTASNTPLDINFITNHSDGSQATSPITLSTYNYGYINGVDGSAWDLKRATGNFNVGEGYTLKAPGGTPQNYVFKGVPNDGDYTFNLTGGTNSLLGNPYPSALDLNSFITDNTAAIDGTIYLYEQKGGSSHFTSDYVAGYGTYTLAGGVTASTAISGTAGQGAYTYTAPKRYLPVGQGFFVGANVGGTVTFSNSQRSTELIGGGNSIFFKQEKLRKTLTSSQNEQAEVVAPFIRLGFEIGSGNEFYHRQLGLSFKAGNSLSYDNGYDAVLFDEKPADAYFELDGNKLVIASVDSFDTDTEIPLKVSLDSAQEVYFNIDSSNLGDQSIYLLDDETGARSLLNNAVVPKTLLAGDYTDRFSIVFKSTQELSIDDLILGEDLTIEIDTENLNVLTELPVDEIILFDLQGRVVAKTSTFKTIAIDNLSKGIYIVKVITEKGTLNHKVYIN